MFWELLIARRFVFTKQREVFISMINIIAVIGITFGVATLIVVLSVMDGYQEKIIEKILGIQSHIAIAPFVDGIEDADKIISDISKMDKVKKAQGIIYGEGMIIRGNSMKGIAIKGIKLEDLKYYGKGGVIFFNKNGDKIPLEEVRINKGEILMGVENMKKTFIEGNRVKIVVPQFTNTFVGSVPRSKSYSIGGFFDCGMTNYNNGVAFMEISDLQLLLDKKDNLVSNIEIYVDHISNTQSVKEKVLNYIKNIDDKKYYAVDWLERNENIINALKMEKSMMKIILSIIIIVAAFNILSGLMVLVQDKKREIAILRIFGASKFSVMSIFILCSAIIGLIGTSCGIGLGIIVTKNLWTIQTFLEQMFQIKLFDPSVYMLQEINIKLTFDQLISISIFSFVCSLLASLYPAHRITKLSPSTVLKDL